MGRHSSDSDDDRRKKHRSSRKRDRRSRSRERRKRSRSRDRKRSRSRSSSYEDYRRSRFEEKTQATISSLIFFHVLNQVAKSNRYFFFFLHGSHHRSSRKGKVRNLNNTPGKTCNKWSDSHPPPLKKWQNMGQVPPVLLLFLLGFIWIRRTLVIIRNLIYSS